MADTTTGSGTAALAALEAQALAELAQANDEAALKLWNTRFFGPNGEVAKALRLVGTLPPAVVVLFQSARWQP